MHPQLDICPQHPNHLAVDPRTLRHPWERNCGQACKNWAGKEQHNNPCSMSTVKQILKNQTKEQWLNKWATGTTGRTYYTERPQPKAKDEINRLNRRSQSIIFQFRTGHAPVHYHLNRIIPEHEPLCRHCNHPYETVPHILFHCSGLQHLRKLLPPNPTIQNTLYGHLDQLRRTSSFLRLALNDKRYKDRYNTIQRRKYFSLERVGN